MLEYRPEKSEVRVLVNRGATVLSDRELSTGLLKGRSYVDRNAKVLSSRNVVNRGAKVPVLENKQHLVKLNNFINALTPD